MQNAVTIPILPCRDIDEIADFYEMLGFSRNYRQMRPNPYVVMNHRGMELHFAAINDFDPEGSYGSCIVAVPDTGALFEEFAAGMRAVHGKLLVSGIPRITRPRKRKNSDNASGFTVVDPGGNWIRIFRTNDAQRTADTEPTSTHLARALDNAVVLGESKGDHRQAAKILDSNLAKHTDVPPIPLVEALAYRAELAVRMGDRDHARTLLAQVRAVPLDTEQEAALSDSLAAVADLEQAIGAE